MQSVDHDVWESAARPPPPLVRVASSSGWTKYDAIPSIRSHPAAIETCNPGFNTCSVAAAFFFYLLSVCVGNNRRERRNKKGK